ncbi:MAG: acetyl-CoA carboxylase, biotin carboxyl carrier protein [Candidatus Eremiobacteraeota bacterium]|nr:acetyl-CoA carboxylase, biotin carboxyl carrier protein [Candidatus Eremiobacteraeota bacterium]
MTPDKKDLDKLVELMQREGLDRLRVRFGDTDIDLRMSLPASAVVASTEAAQSGSQTAGHATEAARSLDVAPPNVKKVLAPLVGVFYRAPAPGIAPFVETGGTVAEGQVLCILEAMKLMNEIVSEYDGTIAKICVDDGDLVTLNQELMWIET